MPTIRDAGRASNATSALAAPAPPWQPAHHVSPSASARYGKGVSGNTASATKKIGGGTWITFITTRSNTDTPPARGIGRTARYGNAPRVAGIPRIGVSRQI